MRKHSNEWMSVGINALAIACINIYKRTCTSSDPHHKIAFASIFGLSRLSYAGLAKTIYILYFWQGNHQIYGHIRCIYTVLANPTHKQGLAACISARTFAAAFTCRRKNRKKYVGSKNHSPHYLKEPLRYQVP